MANNEQNIPPFTLKEDSKEISKPEAKNGDLILPDVDGSKAGKHSSVYVLSGFQFSSLTLS